MAIANRGIVIGQRAAFKPPQLSAKCKGKFGAAGYHYESCTKLNCPCVCHKPRGATGVSRFLLGKSEP